MRLNTLRSDFKHRKDEQGRYLCLVCSALLPGRRKSYCSEECMARNWPSIMRRRVRERDKGICAKCGTDTHAHGEWEMDHIIPVVEGGGQCGIDNYRTLCKPCHKVETAALRKRLAQKRRNQEALQFD